LLWKFRQGKKQGPSVNAALIESLPPLLRPSFFAIFAPAVAKVYIASFRTHDDRVPSKFIVLADNMKSAIKLAWEHGGSDFQSRFDKSAGQAQEMKEGALRVL
jgi:hypothetical protein